MSKGMIGMSSLISSIIIPMLVLSWVLSFIPMQPIVHVGNLVENKVIDVVRGMLGMSRLRIIVLVLGIGSVGRRFWKGFNVLFVLR